MAVDGHGRNDMLPPLLHRTGLTQLRVQKGLQDNRIEGDGQGHQVGQEAMHGTVTLPAANTPKPSPLIRFLPSRLLPRSAP